MSLQIVLVHNCSVFDSLFVLRTIVTAPKARVHHFTTQSPCFPGLFMVADLMISINEHDKITR